MTNADGSHMGHAVKLCCPRRNDVLNVISRLPHRPDVYVDMPSIIVCGDHSSGMGVLLGAITGMPFPVNKSPCSPLIFELALRRNNIASVSVQILPGPYRSEEEQQALGAFYRCTHELDLSSTIKEAEEIIRLNSTDRLFCGDALYVEIAGPTQPHLTLVDLPVLFPVGSNSQFEQDAKYVEDTMLSYIKYKRAIILAVVSAEKDFASQKVITHAQTFDPQGTRTLGVITKPDTLDVGSDSEQFYAALAQNKHVHLQLGWHVLCNRPYATATERDRIEADFLARGVWRRLDPSRCGVKALRTRVSDILYNKTVDELPNITKEVKAVIKDYEQRLLRLGPPRDTIDQKRQFLFRASTAFSGVLKAAVDGWYASPFFACSEAGVYSKRLRTVIQNILSTFAVRMRERGQAQMTQGDEPQQISRARRTEEVRELMHKYRGCELPGTYNPLIVSEIFSKQCRPWEGLIHELGGSVMHYVETVVNEALKYVTDDDTAAEIYCVIVGPYLQELGEALRSKLDELLEPHLLGHPITYNALLTESVRNTQAAWSRANIQMHLQDFFGDLYEEEGNRGIIFDMGALLESLVMERELDMDAYPCTMAIDTADAYYEIALEKIIDDVSVLAIERCLIQKLPDLLAADIICHLTDAEVNSIASESNASKLERALVTEKLTALREGSEELGRFKKQLAPFKSLDETPSKSSTGSTSFKTPTLASDDLKSTDGAKKPDEAETYASDVDNEFWDSIGYPSKGKKPTPKKGKQPIFKEEKEVVCENDK
ncbi:P-loop containing nucleoside triphosphate hydrolase protein [Xylaria longipes]|nr:P-loop containing nucleoside triphosphate hydrolase protein [Xylaria longipes]